MTIALLAAKMIASFEGCKLAAYWDKTGKVWTIGFGHTKKVTRGDVVTFEQAASLLEQDAAPLINLVKDRPLIEAAALVSFGYNCGMGALKRVISGSIVVESGKFLDASTKMPYGEVSSGVRLSGLVRRRELEASLIEASREQNNDGRI